MLRSPKPLQTSVPLFMSKFHRVYVRPSMERDRVGGSLRLHPRAVPPHEFVLRFFIRRDETLWIGYEYGYGRSVTAFSRAGDGGCTEGS